MLQQGRDEELLGGFNLNAQQVQSIQLRFIIITD